MPQTTADPTPSSALDEGTQRGEHLLELARGTLNHFEATASAAQSELDDQYMPSPNAFAVINTMTGERAVRGLHTVTQERRRELRGLTTEPRNCTTFDHRRSWPSQDRVCIARGNSEAGCRRSTPHKLSLANGTFGRDQDRRGTRSLNAFRRTRIQVGGTSSPQPDKGRRMELCWTP